MGWFTAQLAVLLILAFLLGVLAGYLWWIYGYRKNARSIEDDNQNLRASLLEAQKTSKQHESDAAAAVGATASLRSRVEELEGALATSQAEQDELGAELSFMADDDILQAQDAASSRQDADALFAELQAVSAENLSLRADLEAAEASNTHLSRQIETLKGDVDILQTEEDVMAAELEQAEVTALRAGREVANAELQAADELAVAINERDALTVALAESTEERDRAQEHASRLRLERDELRVALSHAQAGHDQTRAEIAALVLERDRLTQAARATSDGASSQALLGSSASSDLDLEVDPDAPAASFAAVGTAHADLVTGAVTGRAEGAASDVDVDADGDDFSEAASFAAVGDADADYVVDPDDSGDTDTTSSALAGSGLSGDRPSGLVPGPGASGSTPASTDSVGALSGSGGRDDDLTRIEGIGPAMATALHKAGIDTFAELSTRTPDQLKEVIAADGLRLAPSVVSWANQASLLARGQTDLFDEYTEWLNAGVPPSDGSTFHAFEVAGFAAVNPDDLKRIEGIGPAMQRALNDAGITTFAQLHHADEQQLRDALDAAGLRLAPSLPTWAEQAGYLVRGDEEGFTALTDRLVAGRRTGDED